MYTLFSSGKFSNASPTAGKTLSLYLPELISYYIRKTTKKCFLKVNKSKEK